MRTNYKNQTNYNWIALIAFIVCVVIDIIFVIIFKDRAPKWRWLWLPLVSAAACIPLGGFYAIMDESPRFKKLICVLSIIWGIIRGLIVVVAYFKATTGFWAIVGAVLLCLFMWIFNAFPFISIGVIFSSNGGNLSVSSPSQSYSENSAPRPARAEKKEEKKDYRPQQGDLTRYFRSYACAPQNGMKYFWQSGPSMRSWYGDRSNYTISGTLGIKQSAIDAFHVTSVEMDQYANAVAGNIESYAHEIISQYRRDYPYDETNFNVEIEIEVTVVNG